MERCLLRPIRTVKAVAAAAPFESLGKMLSSHRAATRVSLAALSFTILIAVSQQAPAQAGPEAPPLPMPHSLLPESVGAAIDTSSAITIPFAASMDIDSVNSAIQLMPDHGFELAWNTGRTALTIAPERLWRTDEQYLVVIGGDFSTADGSVLSGARRFTFTTQTAPVVSDFQVRLAAVDLPSVTAATPRGPSTRSLEADLTTDDALAAEARPIGAGATSQPPTRVAKDVSASSLISIGFSEDMDRADVESHFAIAPEVAGELSWSGTNLVFTPKERLEAGARYTISIAGAHSTSGNALGGKESFSFLVQPGAQMTKATPTTGARDVQPEAVELWFSQPMDEDATNDAFSLVDVADGMPKAGILSWNEARTQLTYVPDDAFAAGREFRVTIGEGGRDADGNRVTAELAFTTKAAPVQVAAAPTVRSAPTIPPPGPATSLAGYALNQVNAARSAYGFAPLVLDASISAVASAHAWDQANNGYFSHYGLDGSSRETRLARGGVSFGWSGENQCYLVGRSQQATLDWCHAQFMAEPYPGYWNHIANILNPNARRMGVGIATVGGKTVITWNFTD